MGLIEEEQALVQMLEKFSIPEGLSEEDRKMILDPLGYDAIKDIDEIHLRNRRETDDPYLKLKMKNEDYKKWKNNDAERR